MTNFLIRETILNRALQRLTADPRTRMASTTVLLEYLLEYHPAKMIRRFKAEMALDDRRFKKSVARCGNFGNSRTRGQIEKLLTEANTI